MYTAAAEVASRRRESCCSGLASSDPTNLQTTAALEDGHWVINGRKWCITGAEGAEFAIVVAKTTNPPFCEAGYTSGAVETQTPGWATRLTW